MRIPSIVRAAFVALLALSGAAAAQGTFPSRPITIVVGFAAPDGYTILLGTVELAAYIRKETGTWAR